MGGSTLLNPPDLIIFSGTDWNDYENRIYDIYLNTVARANLVFLGLPVKVKYRPNTKNKGYGFWHLISESPSQNNRNENDRIPDFRRCERIKWIAWCIQNAESPGFSYWENSRGRETHIVIWAENHDFVVILARRCTQDGFKFYLLKTAYPIRERKKQKFIQERDKWRRQAQND